MFRNEQNKTEDITISFFQTHGESQALEVKTMRFVIPINTGPYALAAASKGFAEYFAKHFDPENASVLAEKASKDVETFRQMCEGALNGGVEREAEGELQETSAGT